MTSSGSCRGRLGGSEGELELRTTSSNAETLRANGVSKRGAPHAMIIGPNIILVVKTPNGGFAACGLTGSWVRKGV